MALRLPLKSGPDEIVELFVCSDPSCRSHGQGNPAAVIRWGEGETERTVPCSFCYSESWVPAVFKTVETVKNGVVVQMPVELIEDAKVKVEGVKIRCIKGEGGAVIRRDSLTYEILEIISQKA